MTVDVSARRRREVIGALRRGTVPESGLDLLAVGLDRFTAAMDDDTVENFCFPAVRRKKVAAAFDGGRIDGGGVIRRSH